MFSLSQSLEAKLKHSRALCFTLQIWFLHEMNLPGGIRWDKKKKKSYLCLCFQVTAITTSAEFCEQQITYSCRMSRLLNTPGKGWGFACLFTTDSNTSTQHWHRQDVLFVTSSGIWREIHVNHSTLSKFPFCLGTLQTNEKGVYGHEKFTENIFLKSFFF